MFFLLCASINHQISSKFHFSFPFSTFSLLSSFDDEEVATPSLERPEERRTTRRGNTICFGAGEDGAGGDQKDGRERSRRWCIERSEDGVGEDQEDGAGGDQEDGVGKDQEDGAGKDQKMEQGKLKKGAEDADEREAFEEG